ncbi:MAG: GlxA family transcriptional regulator [Rhodobacteraceae bacterium]|nr:GlxA family transcriptional regulator [Paracoccaceae bacterium]
MKPAKNLIPPIHLIALVLPNSGLLALAATIDPMRAANRMAGQSIYTWEIRSVIGNHVPMTTGIAIPAQPIAAIAQADILAVIAGFNLRQHATPALRQLLRGFARRLPLICGIDGGGEILARAGLLNGHRATTHWEDHEDLALEFPEIEVVRDRFVQSGKFITTGGAAPCIDMMLHLIETHHGRALAEAVTRTFLYDPRAGSAPQSRVSVSRLQQRAPKVAKAVLLMEANLEDPPKMAEIARACGLSVRRLEMLFQQEFGIGPGRYFRQLRLQEARRMVLDTSRQLQDIAVRCGFNSQAAFSRAFAGYFGQNPQALRTG